MTDIYIADANILFDLFDIDLFEAFLALGLNVQLSLFVMDEIKIPEQIRCVADCKRIVVRSFDTEDIEKIQILSERYRRLSYQDCSVLYLRQKQEAVILSGDNLLRRTAEKLGYEVHGILWVLEQLVENEILTPGRAAEKLGELMRINKRLPLAQCEKQLEWWKRYEDEY